MDHVLQAIGLMVIQKDMYNKKGVYTWKNGAKYEGEWKNNKRHGKGKMINSDGKIYEGDFKENKKDGFGR